MNEFDEMNESTEVTEDTEGKKRTPMFDFLDIVKIIMLVVMLIGGCFVLNALLDNLGEYLSYSSTESTSVSAGIITDKEIINGHTAGGAGVGYYDGKVGYNFNSNKSYVPTVYRIHISAEFEYKGETYQGSNYFDVSEDVYNSYTIGDYFDSKDLLSNSEQSND